MVPVLSSFSSSSSSPPPPFFFGGGGREGVAKGVGEGRGARYVQSLCNLKIKITEGGWKCKQMVGCKKTTTTTKMGGGERERELISR